MNSIVPQHSFGEYKRCLLINRVFLQVSLGEGGVRVDSVSLLLGQTKEELSAHLFGEQYEQYAIG